MLDEGLLDTTEQRPIAGLAIHVSPNYASGEIQVDGVTVSQKNLPSVMKAKLDAAPADGKVVILRGDRAVILGTAVNVLDIAQQAGAKGFAPSFPASMFSAAALDCSTAFVQCSMRID